MSNEPSFIPLSVPQVDGNEWKYIKDCLDSSWVSTAGPSVAKFERDFAAYVGAKHAVACANGTAALHLSLLLAGVRPGDLVLVPTLTFIATINAVSYCGAEPFFFDSDKFYNLSPIQLREFLETQVKREAGGLFEKKSGKRIGALVVTHVFGNAADLKEILPICENLGLSVVEDAAESVGTRYLPSDSALTGGKHTGTLGLVGCISFNGNKIMTTGGGGMIVTNNDQLAAKAKYLSTQAKDDEVCFVHHEVGYNYRMPSILAAMGIAQLERVDDYRARKQAIYERYQHELAGVPGLSLAPVPEYARNNFWMPALQVSAKEYGFSSTQLRLRLDKARIQARPVWELNHRQRPFCSFGKMETKEAERLHELTLNLPCSAGLTDADQARVIQELKRKG